MKVMYFQIFNYRSIQDSGPCYLSQDGVTILAGKNESGKTSILEALEDFSITREIRGDARLLKNRKSPRPKVRIRFQVPKEAIQACLEGSGISTKNQSALELEIEKSYPNTYSFTEESIDLLQGKYNTSSASCEKWAKIIENKIAEVADEIDPIDFSEFESVEEIEEQLKELVVELEKLKDSYQERASEIESSLDPDNQTVDPTTQAQPQVTTGFADQALKLEKCAEKLGQVHDKIQIDLRKANIHGYLLDSLLERIPNFILFKSFEDTFPSEVSLGKQKSLPAIFDDMVQISEMNLDLIKNGNSSEKKRHKTQLNVRVRDDYKKFWTQDLAHLCIEWDGKSIQFFIEENGEYYPPELRSKGKQWHLAFYTRVSARAKQGASNIILIDEPGLFLHATAQKDIHRKLEDAANISPVIFSTHSPYLIPTDALGRVRLVLKDCEKGTTISNKIHKGADAETLTPIMTAIGLDLSETISLGNQNNVLLEGISDFYYLSAIIDLLDFDFQEDTKLIPSTGAEKLPYLASIMFGWGLNFCVVVDSDSAGQRAKKKIYERLAKGNMACLVNVSDKKNTQMEDLFSKEDFAVHVYPGNASRKIHPGTNSALLKEKSVDKVLIAKSFWESVRASQKNKPTINLSDETLSNFRLLLAKINNTLYAIDGADDKCSAAASL